MIPNMVYSWVKYHNSLSWFCGRLCWDDSLYVHHHSSEGEQGSVVSFCPEKYGIGELGHMGVSINGDTQKWIWVNYNISLTWIVLNRSAVKGDDFPYFFPWFQGSVTVRLVMKCTKKWMVYKGTPIKGSMEWKVSVISGRLQAVQSCGLRWLIMCLGFW